MICTTSNLNFTNIDLTKKLAEKNLKQHIAENAYPGRGIVIGHNEENSWIVIYWIMGRSSNSRNRIFNHENAILRTEAADPSLLEDPSLIIYNVMRDVNNRIVVTNGSHTDSICDGLAQDESFYTSLHSKKHEPDHPNYTTRISGIIEPSKSSMALSRITKSDFSTKNSAHFYYRYNEIQPGYGYCVTTYMGDGNPLPAFEGDPIMLPIEGDFKNIADNYWQILNPDNRISLFVRELKSSGKDSLKIINRF
jgi:IMP cyclohydrolase